MSLVFDLESASHPLALSFAPPLTPPGNYKKPEVIAAWLAEAERDQGKEFALDPDLCRVTAIGWAEDDQPVQVSLCKNEQEEADALCQFWMRAQTNLPLVGFNLLGFDYPVLVRRSQLLNVEVPGWEITKYRHPQIQDLYAILDIGGLFRRGDGKVGARTLRFYLQRFGLPCHTDVSGADMAQAAEEGDWELIERHCRQHVEETRALARRLGVLQAEVREEQVF